MGPFGQMQSGGRERAGERVESLARGLGSPERRRARAGLLALLGQRGASGLGRQGRKGAGRGTEKETGRGEGKTGPRRWTGLHRVGPASWVSVRLLFSYFPSLPFSKSNQTQTIRIQMKFEFKPL